ncbi:MAG: hypothetical protein F4022_01320 [Gemmatimonadetes bacterium]|nr:hypothetical protein [Gemmatimonadota bacterium]MYK65092.1 hypothetical protein [Gemmatimonadota bacterium]
MTQETNQSPDTGPADRFVALAPAGGFWQSVDLRICAIRSGSGWVSLVARGVLDHRAPPKVPRFSPVERQDFRAWQVVRPIADLPAVVHGIADGTMKLGPCSVGFISRSGQPGTEMSCSFNEWTASFVAAYDLWSCHSLVGYGSLIWDVVREAGHDPLELDGMIRGGPNPYDGLPDLARRFCGRRQELEAQGHSTVVELVAPLAVRFDPEAATTPAEGIAVGLKAAAEVYVEKAEIAWTVGAAGQPPRHGSRALRTCDWSREGDTLHAELDIPIRQGDSTATSFILIGDRCVDRVTVPLAEAGSNVRIRAHSTVDPGLQRFREHLLPERPEKAREFETAVGLLFFFLGFQVDPLSGQKGLGDAVDHLAHAPGSSVILLIECTVGSIDTGGKVGKLINRSQRTRRELADSEVITVLTTAARRSEVSDAEVEKAERGDVVVLCHEDLHELWTAAQAGEGSTEVVRRLRQSLASAKFRRAEGQVG